MSRREYIPVLSRVLVVRRQLRERNAPWRPKGRKESLSVYLEAMLDHLRTSFGCESLQLDHNPALGLRKRTKDGGYSPAETDHRYLEYRPDDAHLEKTTGRKPGALRTVTTKGSDIWQMKKFRRLEGDPRRKQKIPSRPFPKQRKWRR